MENKSDKIPVIVVCGPTASGKTTLGIELCRALGGEVVSADSMQVYRRLDVGTAKPTPEERKGVAHHMIDVAEPTESYSVARYCAEASAVIAEISSRGKLPIVVGGTGLYTDNLINNTDFSSPGTDEELRAFLAAEAEKKGNLYLHGMLRELDGAEAERIHPNNVKRVIRAIELIKTCGESRQSLNEKSHRPSPYEAVWFAIDHSREALYERINKRVDIMLENGLEAEVRRELLPISGSAPTAIQAIGYKEMLDYFAGLATMDETADKIKQASRRYAKRQLTWFRRNTSINWLSPEEPLKAALEMLKSKA